MTQLIPREEAVWVERLVCDFIGASQEDRTGKHDKEKAFQDSPAGFRKGSAKNL